MKELSLYIHIPFCTSKCYYCDFASFVSRDRTIDEYIDALLVELSIYKEKIRDYEIKTIFIGGGTPSSIDPKHIVRILNYIRENYRVENLTEVSIEVNPGSLDREKLELYIESGINRISLGAQSLNDNLLKSIGRIHNREDLYRSIELIRQSGIENINVDLMFGLPDQSLEDVMETLEQIIKLEIKHISYYGLILEEGTKLYDLYDKGKIDLPHEEEERAMYHSIIDLLKKHDYNHYELSNFARAGYECQHNLVYWDIKPYLGIGLNSHSNLWNKRFSNLVEIDKYIKELKEGILPIVEVEKIDKDTEMDEFCILGLRKIKGIDKAVFKERFGRDIESIYGRQIKKHVDGALIEDGENYIRLTKKGLDLSNLVEVDFLR